MSQSSMVVHKGGKETKYEIYVEDYVLSFLKNETGTLGLSEFYFYGYRERNGKKYTIYGVGKDKDLSVFDQYSLLEEIGCHLTQAGPVFWVKEKEEIYEIKGYEVFYQENAQMQNYLIDQKRGNALEVKAVQRVQRERKNHTNRKAGKQKACRTKEKTVHKSIRDEIPNNAISVQLGVILVVLVAIVINSANSFDKMEQLNQSASEVFFAMENQEAEEYAGTAVQQDEIVVKRDKKPENELEEDKPTEQGEDVAEQEDILKLVALENEEGKENETYVAAEAEEQTGETKPQEGEEGEKESEENQQEVVMENNETESVQTDSGEEQEEQSEEQEENVEALSRNVTRYYEVERGDTLYTISQKIYGDSTHVQKICELNQITNPDNIRYGQKIILP